eukprot:CAMPEP_0172453244 /NCGR_PEP_ID=MMETSP1065-20121228/10659_1 /TAXON_ID=265537 /ORGANISM="Amphiprora paludosa, Strain CCMP125" /LENGTH=518 /DNA_ID=CAMNT_0013205423 /DNA_START=5 /DNA_END=1561 /DNA_ORIENTATION=+
MDDPSETDTIATSSTASSGSSFTQNAAAVVVDSTGESTEEEDTKMSLMNHSRRRILRQTGGGVATELETSEESTPLDNTSASTRFSTSSSRSNYSTFAHAPPSSSRGDDTFYFHHRIAAEKNTWNAKVFKREEFLSQLFQCFFVDDSGDPGYSMIHNNNNPNKNPIPQSKKCRYLLDQLPWRVIAATLACIVVSILYHMRGHIYQDLYLLEQPEWRWDHNVYSPQQQQSSSYSTHEGNHQEGCTDVVTEATGETTKCHRNMLIAQVSGGNTVLNEMSSICSRPNRAYARRWGRDYVQYSKPVKNLVRSCFDKVTVLSTILERQEQHHVQQQQQATASTNNNWMQQLPQPPRVIYDTVALFPPDAIIMDLDQDLLDLLPPDKLLAIAGWDIHASVIHDSNFADVLLVNLQHEYAATVVQVWQSMVEPPVTCGAGNDLAILLQAVESVLAPHEDLSSVVVSLGETNKGLIADNHAIKVIPLPVPGHKANMLTATHTESKAILQTTADSVCYRYYPRCEVL